jgi:arylsulfatase A-like enzyme
MKRWHMSVRWLLVFMALPVGAAWAADRRPNILFLVADEFRHDCLGAAAHPIVKTPNLDALARAGMRLSRAYVAAPVCSPSRATLFTGRYPQVHGVTTNNMPFAPGEVVLPDILHAHGYTTGIVGKLHLQNYEGWFDYDRIDTEGNSAAYRAFLKAAGRALDGPPNTAAVPGSLVKPGKTPLRVGTSVLPEDVFPEAWEADQAIDFIRRQQGRDKPFFLYVSMLKPHSEFVIPAPFDKMYPAFEMPLPATFKPGIALPADFRTAADDPAVKAKSAARRKDGPGSAARTFINDPELLREVIAHYYGAVTMVDKQMGRVLAALAEAGFADDTIVVFTADHGNMLGERNRMFKGVMYEASARVPMLYRAPGIRPGRTSDVIIDNATVMPTLLELAGLPVPAGVQGTSIAPLLRGDGAASAPGVAYSYLRDKMVRKGDWKLIVPLEGPDRPVARRRGGTTTSELYNLAADPAEQVNLYDKPEAAAAQRELTTLMETWLAQKPSRVERPGPR